MFEKLVSNFHGMQVRRVSQILILNGRLCKSFVKEDPIESITESWIPNRAIRAVVRGKVEANVDEDILRFLLEVFLHH